MSQEDYTQAVIYNNLDGKKLARVILNGYNIAAGGPLGRTGVMRSFKIVEGTLWDEWNLGHPLRLKAEDGREATARIAAHPVEAGATGLIEFL